MQEYTHGLPLRAKYHIGSMSPLRDEKLIILPFFKLQHFLLSPPSGVRTKLNAIAQLLPLSNDIKTISVLRRLHGKVAFTHFVVQKCDRQRRKEITSLFRPHPHSMWNPGPTKLGMVIDEVCTILAYAKRVCIQHTVGALKIWGKFTP